MKNLMKYGLIAMLGLMVITTSCNPDDPITVDNDPTATIDFGADYENQTFEPGKFLGPISVTFTAGESDLNGVYVYRNGEKLPVEDFLVDNESKAANPFNLSADQKQTVSFDFAVQLSDEEVTDTYAFEVVDVDGNTAAVTLDITTEVQGTPVEMDTMYLLWNADGREPGGLDLDADDAASASVSRSSAEAEIVDKGVNFGASDPADNWYQQILPANGSTLMPYDGDFDAVTTKEQIAELYDETATVDESDVVQPGDVFIVKNGDKYYIIEATDVVVIKTSEQADSNDDYYTFSVKK